MSKEIRKLEEEIKTLKSRLKTTTRNLEECWTTRDILITAGKLFMSDWEDALDLLQRPAGYSEWEAAKAAKDA